MASLGIEGLKSNINNYKGVMLCTRPNENIAPTRDLPFVSRVDPKEQLGLNPVRKLRTHQPMKRGNPILRRHREWLEDFKQRMREKRENEEIKDRTDKERFERIREQAQLNKMRTQDYAEEYLDAINNNNNNAQNISQEHVHVHVQQEQTSPNGKAAQEKSAKANKKKKEKNISKPKWAYTEEQLKQEEEEDVDDLLEFTSNLDYDKYINDLEVKHMVTALKKRIDELKNKQEDDWKNKIVDEWNDRKTIQPSKVDLNYDNRSDRSMMSETRSVASEKSHKSIQDIKAKITSKEKDWDKLSTTTKKNAVTLEERIAKHVADEILRNHTEFRHFHSNASVRKILEREAQKHLEDTTGIKAPEIVANKEYFTRKDVRDPNNLPYLHRNPAI